MNAYTNYASYTGYTGRLFEEEILGEIHVSWDGYMTYNRSLEYAKEHQEWDPSDPETPKANDLHALVAIALNLEDWSNLKFYNAVDTPMDYFHGVDCFFEFDGEIVTIDLTVNPHKREYKADLIVHPDDLEEKKIRNLAYFISNLLQKKCRGGI